jgi:hypothetical protein
LIALLVAAGEFASDARKSEPLALALVDARRFSRRFSASASAWVERRLSDLPSMEPGRPAYCLDAETFNKETTHGTLAR